MEISSTSSYTRGIYIYSGKHLTLEGTGKLKINATGADDIYGISIATNQANESIHGLFKTDLEINVINNNHKNGSLYGIYNNTSNSVFNGELIANVKSDASPSYCYAIYNTQGKIIFNKNVNASITTTSEPGWLWPAALNSDSNSETTFNGDAILNADGNASTKPIIGTKITNGSKVNFNRSIDIKASNTNGDAIGIFSQSNSIINCLNDVNITSKGKSQDISLAIYNDINSKLSISKQTDSLYESNAVKVTLSGIIDTEGNSQTIINAGADSLIDSTIIDDTTYDDPNHLATSTTLALHNGATWQNTGESNLTNLVMNNGILTQSSTEAISIANYSGTGKALFTANDDATNGVAVVSGGNIKITNASQGSVLNADLANNNKINSLDKTQAEASLNAIANKLIYTANDGNLTGTVHLQEGLITPAISATLNFDENKQGYVTNIQIAEDNTNTGGNNGENNNNNGNNGGSTSTTTMDAMRNIGAASIISWRQEDSTLGQRLGVLRESKDDGGIWVRMNRGKYEYQNALHGQYNFFQIGYDKAFGNWHYGAAISHNDGKTTYTNGKGNNDSTSLSLYGTWLGNAGHYADIVLKEGRLSTDYDIYAPAGYTHGKYNNWGTSISGEYGRKIDFQDFYLTPQAQLTFMRIGGKNYTTANDIQIDQDSLYSTVGRIGVEIGKNITDKGNAYLRTSLLHEFAGDADTRLMLNGISNSYTQDIGNTWYELGIGFNYQTAANSYLYADVAKTFGDDYKTPWQWNVGMRWNF